MALVRVAQYNSTPTAVEDYQAQNAHLQAFTNQLLTQQFILDSGTAQPVIKQGCYVSHGGSLYVADADTSITGSPSDGSVYIRVSGTTSLTVEFINNISGYAWNPVYSALTSGSYTLLPYLIVKASTVWTRYNFNPNNQSFGDTRLNSLAVTGAISGAEITAQNRAVFRGRDMTYGFANVVRKKPFEQYNGQGVAYDGTNLYILADGVVYRCTNGIESVTVLDSIDLSGITGIAWVDDKLVTCSLSTIYIYDGYSSTLLSSFSTPKSRCAGLGVKNGNLVSIDYATRTIYEHIGVTSVVSESISIMGILSDFRYGYNLRGVCWTGENYIVSAGSYATGFNYADILSISKDNLSVYDAININEYAPSAKIAGACLVGNGRLAIVGEENTGQNYVYELLTMIR